MKVSERWLREWIDPPLDTRALAEQLTSLGLEEDGIESARPAFENVVVGRIVATRQHPDADRLRVCTVEAGEEEPLQVVCGAPNAREGLSTAFARVGGRLPDGTRLKKAKLRGVESHGMLCSAAELGLSEERSGIMELAGDAPPGTELGSWLGLDDAIIEVDLTPDRADCLSIRGLARDLSAKNDLPLIEHPVTPLAPELDDTLAVTIDENSACARFTGRVVRDVDMRAPVPPEIVERLRRAGVRSISPGVDVTNHVMLERGQPMHAFDLDKLSGGIRVRLAKPGEPLTLLDGREIELDAETTVIADESGAIAIAGVMGGLSTAVDENTTNVFLESALFLPAGLIGKPRRYGCHTESSHRFERGVDPAGQREALEVASAQLIEIAGGRPGPVVEAVHEARLPRRETVTLRASRLARVLGTPVPDEEVVRILERLGIRCEPTGDDDESVRASEAGGESDRAAGGRGWRVTPPSHRYDLAIEEDYIEEVGRVRGYEALPRTIPTLQPTFRALPEDGVSTLAVKRLLSHRGYQEVITYSFVDGQRQAVLRPDLAALALPAPISSELGVMRTTLVGGLIEVWRRNAARQGDSMRLFESGLRFLETAVDEHLSPAHGEDIQIGDSVRQQNVLAGLVAGRRERESWNTSDVPVDFFSTKADVEALIARAGTGAGRGAGALRFGPSSLAMLHPGQRTTLLSGEVPVGYVGRLHPGLQSTLDLPGSACVFEISLAALREAAVPVAVAPSRFPRVRRDLALLVDDELSHERLVEAVRKHAPRSLGEVVAFDVYRGEGVEKGKKSMALGLILQDNTRTLGEQDVEKAVARIVAGLEGDLGARLRDVGS